MEVDFMKLKTIWNVHKDYTEVLPRSWKWEKSGSPRRDETQEQKLRDVWTADTGWDSGTRLSRPPEKEAGSHRDRARSAMRGNTGRTHMRPVWASTLPGAGREEQ